MGAFPDTLRDRRGRSGHAGYRQPVNTARRPGQIHHSDGPRRERDRCVDDTLALLVVNRALVQSYPAWTDEHGTNVEQLAEIAVRALAEHGLLVEPEVQPVPTGHA
jgi:hypothetical protein